MRALIGSTGFVGGSLLRQTSFDVAVHSTNVDELRGRSFELVVCAGAPAAKWKANKEPAADLANIERLMDVLRGVRAQQFILISTVDVFGKPQGVTEESAVDLNEATAYGRHRKMLEEFVQARFPATVLRLPGLFGTGLRKNVIFDLLHDNNVDQIHPEGVFQYYETDRLWQDIGTVLEHRLPLVHLSAEPIRTSELAERCFGVTLPARAQPPPMAYDMRSNHSALWGRSDGYQFGREETFGRLTDFVRRSREARP